MVKLNLTSIETAIREVAAQEILPRFRNLQQGDIAFKIGDDPVTIADQAAEKALSELLIRLLPGSMVLGEEAFAADSSLLALVKGESPVWIIDPIDGTRAFVAGQPYYGVIVALSLRNQVLAGWFYDPGSDEFVTAEQGSGAWHQGQRLTVNRAANFAQLVGCGGDRVQRQWAKLPDTVRLQGPQFKPLPYSGCHEYPRLWIDQAYFGNPAQPAHFRAIMQHCTPWDDAAATLMQHEAGGYCAHWDGTPILPSSYQTGTLWAPDQECWHQLRKWILNFCPMPVTAI
jgi:fructose-1,6-bisphosphatase/inositol monophosphatase family enzyme